VRKAIGAQKPFSACEASVQELFSESGAGKLGPVAIAASFPRGVELTFLTLEQVLDRSWHSFRRWSGRA
jgi:hypothetical protein